MKRYFSLVLTAVVLVVSLVFPVSATDVYPFKNNSGFDYSTDGYSVDLTPYLDNTHFTFSGTTEIRVRSFFDYVFSFCYVDVVFRTDSTNFLVSTSEQYLSIEQISSDLYRAYGRLKSPFDSLEMLYFDLFNGSYLDISSVKGFMTDTSFNDISYSATLSGSYSYRIYHSDNIYDTVDSSFSRSYSGSNDSYIDSPLLHPHVVPSGVNAVSVNDYNVFSTLELFINWKKYDRVDFYFYNNFDDLVDYAFYVDDINVLSSIQSVIIDGRQGTIISLDFSSLNRSKLSDTCVLRFRGYQTFSSDESHQILYIHGITGFVKIVSENFWPSWLIKIISKFDSLGDSITSSISAWSQNIISSISSWGQAIVDAIVGDQTQNETINNALDTQESVNQQINVQLGSAVDDWDGNVSVVSGGFNTAFQNASPSLNWLSNLAQSVWSGMGWFGNMFFFLGFLHVFFLLMSKSGLGRSIANAARRSDSK